MEDRWVDEEKSGASSDSGEFPVLPKHTRVLVVGNSRTKPSLINLEGVVKRASQLGGWHSLVLSTGEEVRLQRNALSVIEHPTGDESDFSDEDDETEGNQSSEPLPRTRPRRPPRPAPSPDLPHARRTSTRQATAQPRINFHKLETAALRRYRRFYKLADVGPNSTKDQLVNAVGRHFMAHTVDEDKVIAMFVQAARRQATLAAEPQQQ